MLKQRYFTNEDTKWSLPVNEHSSIHCPVYVVMLLHVNSFFFLFFFCYLNFLAIRVLSTYKFREDLFSRVFNFAIFFSIARKSEVMYTNNVTDDTLRL